MACHFQSIISINVTAYKWDLAVYITLDSSFPAKTKDLYYSWKMGMILISLRNFWIKTVRSEKVKSISIAAGI